MSEKCLTGVFKRDLSWNTIADHCQFILSEIKNSQDNLEIQRINRIRENEKKIPVSISQAMHWLQDFSDNLYDINLHIYKANRSLTIVDIRYFLKSAVHGANLKTQGHVQPMLHCKVARPPWMLDENKKFDINWEHKEWLIKWKLFWLRRRLKTRRY